MPEPRRVTATRYVTPLREGGSLPGLVEADDDGLYVVKFRGAGQGPRDLAGEPFGDAEPDEELQDLVHRSGGLNLGLDFLPGALMFNPAADPEVEPDVAADVVWLDAFVTNPDRTAANPNLLVWHGRTWLIDHGAALYVHHAWRDPDAHAEGAFERIRDHVLLPFASDVAAADQRLAPRLGTTVFEALVAAIPDAWLPDDAAVGDAAGQRFAYVRYLERRLAARARFVEEADRARRAA